MAKLKQLERVKPKSTLEELKEYEDRMLRKAVDAMQSEDHDRAQAYRDRAKAAGKGLFLMRPDEEARDVEFTGHKATMNLYTRCHKEKRVTHKVP
jgi:hypothetical protein